MEDVLLITAAVLGGFLMGLFYGNALAHKSASVNWFIAAYENERRQKANTERVKQEWREIAAEAEEDPEPVWCRARYRRMDTRPRMKRLNVCINKRCLETIAPGRYLCPACRLVWRIGLFIGGAFVGGALVLLRLAGKL